MKHLYDVVTVMVTPLDENDRVDEKALRDSVDFLIDKGVNCLYPTGTTGEMYLLTIEERR